MITYHHINFNFTLRAKIGADYPIHRRLQALEDISVDMKKILAESPDRLHNKLCEDFHSSELTFSAFPLKAEGPVSAEDLSYQVSGSTQINPSGTKPSGLLLQALAFYILTELTGIEAGRSDGPAFTLHIFGIFSYDQANDENSQVAGMSSLINQKYDARTGVWSFSKES